VRFALFIALAACDAGSGSGAPIAVAPKSLDAAPSPIDAGLVVEIDRPPSPLCIEVVAKIEACWNDPTFVTALDAGATADRKRDNAKQRRNYAKYIGALRDPGERCRVGQKYMFERESFFDHLDMLAGSDVLASCASLGAALAKASGVTGDNFPH
jgi:hypothetical protein